MKKSFQVYIRTQKESRMKDGTQSEEKKLRKRNLENYNTIREMLSPSKSYV